MIKVILNFITKEEEDNLLLRIKSTKVTHGPGRNSIIRFGSKVPYQSPIQNKDLPKWAEFLVLRLIGKDLIKEAPDSLTINEYHKGQSIDWHVDSASSGPVITVLSLKSDATMGLKSKEGQESLLSLPARSLVQMTDKERWEWKHCIMPVKNSRFSLVFRKGAK